MTSQLSALLPPVPAFWLENIQIPALFNIITAWWRCCLFDQRCNRPGNLNKCFRFLILFVVAAVLVTKHLLVLIVHARCAVRHWISARVHQHFSFVLHMKTLFFGHPGRILVFQLLWLLDHFLKTFLSSVPESFLILIIHYALVLRSSLR